MNARWAPGIVALMVLTLAGCDNSQPRSIHGQINLSDYSLRQPTVLVESGSHLSYVARVSATGSFSITVPAGQSYRLTLADRTTTGSLALASRILWSAKGQNFVWAKIGGGSTINFGLIRPVGATVSRASDDEGQNGNSQGQNDDSQCDEDDNAQGNEEGPGPTDGGVSCRPPMQPPSNPPLCMPGSTLGNSTGDRDEDGDQDNHDYGDDDRDGNGVSAAQCDGGVMVSGDDDNQGNDNAQGNEDEDDGDGNGKRCVAHVPTCPPGTPPGGGTTPPGGGTTPPGGGTTPPGGGTTPPGGGTTPPGGGTPPGPPDMATPPIS
jgi:hypothetical protein